MGEGKRKDAAKSWSFRVAIADEEVAIVVVHIKAVDIAINAAINNVNAR